MPPEPLLPGCATLKPAPDFQLTNSPSRFLFLASINWSDNTVMRRWILCAGLCALLALPVWGQRGGGGHGGMGGGGHSFSSGGGGYAAHGAAGYGYHGPVGGYRAPSYSGAYRAPYGNGGYRG